jgi:carbonic anhydrase
VQELIAGVKKFQRDVFPQHRALFHELAGGQAPDVLVITCSDSRVDPNMLMQAKPGRIFELRNAGNIVPRFSSHVGGVTATIEFAVVELKISNIIICGHSGCGAMTGLLSPGSIQNMPNVQKWLKNAEPIREALANTGALEGPDALSKAIEANIIVQLDHLRTHPCVAQALAAGRLAVHGWVYDIATGNVETYDEQWKQFVPL